MSLALPQRKIKLNPNYRAIQNLTQYLKKNIDGAIGFSKKIQLYNVHGVLFNYIEFVQIRGKPETPRGIGENLYRLSLYSIDEDQLEDVDLFLLDSIEDNEAEIHRVGHNIEQLVSEVFKFFDRVKKCKNCEKIYYDSDCLDCLLHDVVIQSAKSDQKFTCSICSLEQLLHERVQLKCGHQICRTCKGKICSCPICRASFN